MTNKKDISKKKMGRPPAENPCSAQVPATRVTPDKLEAYKEKAKDEGKSFSQWVRAALDNALKRKSN